MHRREQFSLLIVRGDGTRIVRFNFARPLAAGVLAGVAIATAVFGVLFGNWLHLRDLTREAVNFEEQLADKQETIETFNRRTAELRKEITGWRELHARIWEPFGPEMGPKAARGDRRDGGIGGVSAEAVAATAGPMEELDRLAEALSEQGESLRALDRVMTRAGKVLATLPSRWPVRGAVNSEFGRRRSPWTPVTEFHGGMDISAGRGTAVRAPAAGVVHHAGHASDFGIAVILDHGQDLRTVYGHLSRVAVKQGQRVERGDLIAYTGNTGRSTGPHLHYEIHVRGRSVNPRAFLWY
jgi:murein DD-endopeptidase MepM/ murein hydrolase activator NlpD